MKTRLWKELRSLMPYWIGLPALGLAGWMVAHRGIIALPERPNPSFPLTDEQAGQMGASFLGLCTTIIMTLAVVHYLVFHLITASAFTREFNLHTMDRLLAQPLSRVTIYKEKLYALLLIMGVALLGNVLIGWEMLRYFRHLLLFAPPGMGHQGPYMYLEFRHGLVQYWCAFTLCGAALALASGPLMALLLRQMHTAFLASLIVPILVVTLFSYFDYIVINWAFHFSIIDWANRFFFNVLGEFNLMILFTIFWFAIVFPLGWLKFKSLEV